MESNFEWITANGDIGIRFFHSIDGGPRHVPMGFTSGLIVDDDFSSCEAASVRTVSSPAYQT